MNNTELQLLANYIYEFCGIDYRKNLPSLESKIEGRIKELKLSLWEYTGYVKVDDKEKDLLIELITVNETYFFREDNLLTEIEKVIYPQYKDRTSINPLRIWCAACSSGEEPYTLAMLVKETNLFKEGAVEIIASDINKKVLNKAKKALYHKKSLSFRKMPAGMTQKYFDDDGDNYKIKDEVRSIVKFKHINMFDKNVVNEIGKVDIIICRNVLIYFDTDAIKKLVGTFYQLIKHNGYLLLGHAETITNINPGFETIYTPSIFYYKKEED
ncbi:protein-glutamate O-methyltransferase CheR [Clostridium sp. C8-1-8]|uniref:CheR family methyltransferase n=1 Tax=Clostridium sp. C8-1-8 TaxID=2698831 RepID=UPI00136BFD2E|nr:protein-glutamate O-methyltransferase CheR [Clostridium sp. C8-1-8]